MAKNPAHSFVGVDDAEQHSQRRCLARTIRAENAVDSALRHRYVHSVDSENSVESLDQPASLQRQRAVAPFASSIWTGKALPICVARHRPIPYHCHARQIQRAG